jgi:hypothetical protein
VPSKRKASFAAAKLDKTLKPKPKESQPDPEPEERPNIEPPTDPMELIEGYVPVYNPQAFAVDIQVAGVFFHVRPKGVDFMPEWAADHAVGVDNSGGTHSVLGLRRLYGPEPRMEQDAKRAGMSLENFAAHRNRVIREVADQVCQGVGIDPEVMSRVELNRL